MVVVEVVEIASAHRIASCGERGEGAVGLAVGVGVMADREEVGSEVIHVGGGEYRSSEESVEGGIEALERGAVAAPVEGGAVLEAAEGLSHHGAFHGVHGAGTRGGVVGGEVRSRDSEHGTGGVAEIPCESIGVGIEVAGSTAHGSIGREPGIEEEAACFGDRARESRVGTDRAFVDHLAVRGVDDREGIG